MWWDAAGDREEVEENWDCIRGVFGVAEGVDCR